MNASAKFVLYHDNTIIVTNKPAGMLSQADRTGTPDVLTRVKKTVNGPVYLVHRLDRNVSGVMIFARTKDAAADLQKQFRQNESEKRYTAFVYGTPSRASGEIVSMILKDSAANRVYSYPLDGAPPREFAHEAGRAQKARTTYTVIARYSDAAQLDVVLHTGRSHQIRVHMADIRHPVIGDNKYGEGIRYLKGWKKISLPRLALHSVSLCIRHPRTGKQRTFTVPLPDDLIQLMQQL